MPVRVDAPASEVLACLCTRVSVHKQYFCVPATIWAPSRAASESVSIPLQAYMSGCESAGPAMPLDLLCFCRSLCVPLCLCHSMRGHRSLCASQSLWLESFSAYARLRVTFVYLCVFLNDSVCSHVVRSFWVCVCGFVSACISRVFVVSVSRTVDEWKWSFSQTPFVSWPCAAWKPQAVISRGRTWAWAALSGHLGRGRGSCREKPSG